MHFFGCNISIWKRCQNYQPVKTSALSWPICQKSIRESYWSFPLYSFSYFPPCFLSFLLLKLTSNKNYFFQVPATCQHQHRSQYELQFPPFLHKGPFLVLLTTEVSVKLASPLCLFLGWLWALTGAQDKSHMDSSFGYYSKLQSCCFFSLLITQYRSYQGNLILYLVCKRKPRRLVRDI